MGWLHDGHRALIAQARAADATTVVSIFVNPRQFNVGVGLQPVPTQRGARPRDLRGRGRGSRLRAGRRRGLPAGFDTTVSVGAIAEPLEGAARPGHFDGVATVVAILFGLVGADHAYFGQKDAQQVMVIRQMARDLAIPTTVIACPTIREPDGLAMSSRNVHLSPAERAAAPVLRRALLAARDALGGRRTRRRGPARDDPRRDRNRAAGRGRLRLVRRRDHPGRADRVDGPALAVARGPLRHDPPHRQRTAGDRRRGSLRVLVAGVRVLLAYLAFYAALGAAYPFMPVFYRDLGLALDEIGILIAVQAGIMLVFGPVWGGLSDRFPRSRVALPLAAAVATAGAVVLYLSLGFLAVFIGAIVLFIGIAGVAPTARCPDAGDPRLGGPQPVRAGPRVRVAGVRRRDAGRRRHARPVRAAVAVLGLHPDAGPHGHRDRHDPAADRASRSACDAAWRRSCRCAACRCS